MAGRLDDEQLAELRAWAERLLDEADGELRAAARGLLLLVNEVELLRSANRSVLGVDLGTALADRLGKPAKNG